jgi:hypothetical protein
LDCCEGGGDILEDLGLHRNDLGKVLRLVIVAGAGGSPGVNHLLGRRGKE